MLAQLAPAKTALAFVEISTGSSKVTALRTAQGAITSAIVTSDAAASPARPRQGSGRVSASGSSRRTASMIASPRVSAASPASAPSATAAGSPGARWSRSATSRIAAIRAP